MGIPAPGRSLILPLAEARRDRFDVWLPSECSPRGLVKAAGANGGRPHGANRAALNLRRRGRSAAATCDELINSRREKTEKCVFGSFRDPAGPEIPQVF